MSTTSRLACLSDFIALIINRLKPQAELTVGEIGSVVVVHPQNLERYRLSVRAQNRAGLYSADWDNVSLVAAVPGGTPPAGAEIKVDLSKPECINSTVAMCDPRATAGTGTNSAACNDLSLAKATGAVEVGTATNGFQAATDAVRVRWEGFTDAVSGVSACVIEVKAVLPVGRVELGQWCTCSASLPPPHCDCGVADDATGLIATCDVLNPLTKASFFGGAHTPRSTSQGPAQVRVCVPPEPFNYGTKPISAPCTFDRECAPLPAAWVARVPTHADQRVLCVPMESTVWFQRERPALFCCGPEPGGQQHELGTCLPAAMVAAFTPPSPPQPPPPPALPPVLPPTPCPLPPALPPQLLPMLLALTPGPAHAATVAEGDRSHGRALSHCSPVSQTPDRCGPNFGACFDTCCSLFGWCGTGPDYCAAAQAVYSS